MKKIIVLLLAVVMCLPLIACGGNNTTSEETTPEVTTPEATTPEETTPEVTIPEETTEPEPEIPVVQVKETVSTDIIDLTLEHSKLTYYVSNNSSNYVEATDQPNTLFAARMGTCYVSMTVTIKNKDRGGSMSFCGGFGAWDAAGWTVTYNGEEYPIYGFDLNSHKSNYISLSNAALVNKETGTTIKKIDTGNILISAGETYTIRLFGIIEVDPVSLDDGFALTVKVPNSSGEKELYTYNVPPVDKDAQKEELYTQALALIDQGKYKSALEKLETLGDYKDAATLYEEYFKEWAVRHGVVDAPKTYFLEHINEFEIVTGSELSAMMVGDWKLSKGSSVWTFKNDGTIDDGWGNDRWWSVSGDALVLESISVTGNHVKDNLVVKRVCDDGYLLVKKDDGALYCTMYKPN